jgi:hypothetical protein
MKIVADTADPSVESTLNDVVRLAEVHQVQMCNLFNDHSSEGMPEAFVDDVCNAVTIANLLCEAMRALKAEWYADFERGASEPSPPNLRLV